MNSSRARQIPTGSQTVGPYFTIGLDYLTDRMNQALTEEKDTITLTGHVLDAKGKPVPDAMIEFWTGDKALEGNGASQENPACPRGFRRARTNDAGEFSVKIPRPGVTPAGDGSREAPHVAVLVFARGLLRNLVTRVYFQDADANARDVVLNEVPAERRATLIARSDNKEKNVFNWDIVLQGKDETVFFAW